ncbi:MAG: Na+/H+ antiporter NhaA [Azospirillum brasilense]|nr:MAG: Na+/H+ antiporter NhaA [Azospirillum brasilense]
MSTPAHASTREQARIGRLLKLFLRNEAAGGVVMLCCALLAMVLANSPLGPSYQAFIHAPLQLTLGETGLRMSMEHFVKDVLMAIFFLLVGMELKREMLEGFLSKKGQKLLPLVAALGGIVVPALIYYALNHTLPDHVAGWAIPTATDIAFAVCVLALVGKHVPTSAKIFLLAIAIYDDLAAILIIALFYSKGLALVPLAVAAAITLLLAVLSRRGVSALPLYLLLGAGLWEAVHQAGIHTTVAGMIVGLCIPLRPDATDSESPLNRLMHFLHPWVAFAILPLFAFVSAGVELHGLRPADLLQPLPLGIALGLFVGKQLGIFAATFAAIKLGLAARPQQASWGVLYGVAVIAGIGFTMSLFVGYLAFHDEAMRNSLKLGVIAGSLLSALWGMGVMRLALRPRRDKQAGNV